jgi:hypothetical protein
MKWILALPVVLGVTLPANAETIYLIIKSSYKLGYAGGLTLVTIPMETMDKCEEAGATIASSTRFDLRGAESDAFECIKGK